MPTKTTKSVAKPAAKTAAKAPIKKPAAAKAPAKPIAKAPAKAAAVKPKAAASASAKPAAKKAVSKAAAKPAVKATAKSIAKPAAKPTPKVAAKTPLQKEALKAAPKKAVSKKAVAEKAVTPKAAKPVDPIEQLARNIAQTLDTNKAEAIVTIPLAGRSSLADWMVIASGKSGRQVGALANYVQRALAEAGCKRVRTEGLPQGDWVVIDSGDIVTHIFRPEVRDYYQLERLWAEDEGEPAQTRTLR